MNRLKLFILALGLSGLFASCQDVIDIQLEDVPPQLVVDGWLNNLSEPQTVRLTLTQPYFSNTFAPGVEDATVVVVDDQGKVFEFSHAGEGNYVWTPDPGENLGSIGTDFALGIEWNGNSFAAASPLNRVPPVDSITSELRENELGFPDGYYAQFFARDFPGVGDTYWIKTYKNGEYLNKPFELNFAYDAAFSPGAATDGLIFITPIREAVNRVPDPDTQDDDETPPWVPGDSIRVEIHSINPVAFDFLRIAREQMTNGSNTIFALPLANTRTNLITVSGSEEALGFFCISGVTSMDTVIVAN